jgi:hypothetical protein
VDFVAVSESQSIRIWHENLAAMNSSERLPLSALAPDQHIHGGLRIEIRSRLVPYLGYFGPDDICFNTWLEELWSAAQAFESSGHARHTFDEGEQGQPAFVFEREDSRAYFSIAAAEFSGGVADPDWQRVEFSPSDFLAEHARFRESFFATLRADAPKVAELWIRNHDPQRRQRL